MAYRIHAGGRTNSISTAGVRVLQAMLVAVVLAACLLWVPILGGSAPAVQHRFNPQEFASYRYGSRSEPRVRNEGGPRGRAHRPTFPPATHGRLLVTGSVSASRCSRRARRRFR